MPAIIYKRANESNGKSEEQGTDNSMKNLLITLVILVAFCLVLGGSLVALKRIRRSRKEAGTLPSYDAATRNHNRLTVQTNRDSTFLYSEKQNLIDNSSPMPMSPENVPEIRITFPEEEDKDGRRVSGRVVVVQVGEAGVGFVKPLIQDDLPPYQQNRSEERFNSIDIDRIGGLKEIR
jgi:hypothetical protein